MKKTSKGKKIVFFIALVITLALSYSCVDYAAERAGMVWYIPSPAHGFDSEAYVGYVVVDAIYALDAMGPLRNGSLSMMNDDVEMIEEGIDGGWRADQEVSVDWRLLIVNSGETLSHISETYGVSIENIVKANELTDQHRIREGQALYLPNGPETVEVTLQHVRDLKNAEIARLKEAQPIELTDYVVQEGDTLWKIANEFNLDVNSVFGTNRLPNGDLLRVGSVIKVPNQDGILITINQGHTLEGLAREYSIYQEAIMSANRLSGTTLTQGSELFLPGATVAMAAASGASAGRSVTARRSFAWPVVGRISSQFGWRRNPFGSGRDFHTGLDIRAPRGRTIVAAAAGRVVHAGWMGGYGLTVVVSHPGGITTLYAHASRLLVRVGANVNRGQAIAQVGSTGRSTGNHLHFEVRSGGRAVNPIQYLR